MAKSRAIHRIIGAAGFTLAVFATLAPAFLRAHEGATGTVLQRMELMKEIGRLDTAIAHRIRNKRDLAGIKADAEALQALAGKISPLFPQGSGGGHSEARDAIWQNWPDYVAAANALAAESGKLAGVPPNDFAAIKTQARALGDACVACHDKYRLKQ